MRSSWRSILTLGGLTWLIPFVASVPFVNADGELLVPVATFKSLMLLIGGSTGALLMARVLRGPVGGCASDWSGC